MGKTLVLLVVALSVACGVQRKKVGDRPPAFVFGFSEQGETFGHIVVAGGSEGTKAKYGNSFSAFLWPDAEKVGGELGGDQYYKLVLFLKSVSKFSEIVTQIQNHRTLFDTYKTACNLEIEDPTFPPFSVRCPEVPDYSIPTANFRGCASPNLSEGKPADDVCACIAQNGKHVTELLVGLGIGGAGILPAKSEVARCAFEMVDPYPDRSENWLMGDFKKRNGQLDENGESGSRIGLVDMGNGKTRVVVDLVNFDGNNYTTENLRERKHADKWGRIENAEYERGKGIIRFDLIERGHDGRVFKFDLSRSWPFKTLKDYNKIGGEIKVYKDGKLVQRGQVNFAGHMFKQEPDMPSIWSTLISDK